MNQSIADDVEKGLDNLLNQIKKTIFDVLAILFKEEEQEGGMLLFYIQTSLDYIQMHNFPFAQKIYFLWKASSLLEFVFTVFNYVNISTYLPSINYETYMASVYVLVFVILLMIIDILYVSYSFQRKRFSAMWPLHILRSGVSLVVTIFFLPITEILISVITCQTNDSGQYAMTQFPNVVCWTGWHIFHAIISQFFNLLFTSICTIAAFTFFEPRMNSGDRTARQDSSCEVAFIMNKVTCQVLYSFLGPESSWILVLTTFTLSVWLYKKYNIDDPYYDWEVGLFYNVASTYYLWTNSWLLISQILYNTTFSGSVIAWILGLPFLVAIMVSMKKSKIETLVRSTQKFKSGEEINNHIRYVLQLIQNQETDKNSYMLLIGYIEQHKVTCKSDECQLRWKNNKKILTNNINILIDALIVEIDNMFLSGLNKFPNCTQLRISYAFFLLERRNNKKKAFEQFYSADKYGKPAFYQQFIVFRYCKIIKDNQDDKGDSDVISVIEFENHMNQCDEAMKISAGLHKDFWLELKEEQPDLMKLNQLGQRISRATTICRESYFKMQKLNPMIFQSIRAYGLFLINVLNDKQQGRELLEQSKIVQREQMKNQSEDQDSFILENDYTPSLTVSMKGKDGKIVGMNQLIITYLGYQKQELIGKSVNQLIPRPYCDYHNQYLTRYFENCRQNNLESEYLNVEQKNYFKHKNEYLLNLKYKVTLRLEQLLYFIQFFTDPEQGERNQVHIIVDKQTNILELSSGAISLFGLERKAIKNADIKLDYYLDNVLHSNHSDQPFRKMIKGVETVQWVRINVKQIRLKHFTAENDEAINLDYYTIKFQLLDKGEVKITAKTNMARQSVDIQKLNPSSQVQLQQDSEPRFSQQNLNPEVDFLMQTFNTAPTQQLVDYVNQMIIRADDRPVTLYQDSEQEQQIKIKRLINNKIVDIDYEMEEMVLKELEEDEQEDSIFKDRNEFQLNKLEYEKFSLQKQRSTIVKSLNTQHTHLSIKKFRLFTLFFILFFIGASIYQYANKLQIYNDQEFRLRAAQVNQQITYQITRIIQRSMDLLILKNGFTNFNFEYLKTDVDQAIVSLNDLAVEIGSHKYIYGSYFFENQLNFNSYGLLNEESNMTLDQILSAIITITDQLYFASPDDLSLNSPQIQSLLHNYYPKIQPYLHNMLTDIYKDSYDNVSGLSIDQIIFILIVLIVTVLSTIKFIQLMIQIRTQRENILFLFLAIPDYHLATFKQSCEQFLKSQISIKQMISQSNELDYSSSEDEIQQDNKHQEQFDSESMKKQSQKNKKVLEKYYQSSFKGYINIIAVFVVIGLIPLTNLVFQLVTMQQTKDFLQLCWPQYYSYQYFVNGYMDHYIFQNTMLINYSYEINNTNIVNKTDDHFKAFQFNQEKLRKFSSSVFDQFSQFAFVYDTVQYFIICDPVKDQISEDHYNNCLSYCNTTMTLGVIVGEQFLFQYFYVQKIFFDNMPSQFYSPLLADEMLYQIDWSLINLMSLGVNYMLDYERILIIQQLNSDQALSLLTTIIYISVFIVFYVIILMPFFNQLNKNVIIYRFFFLTQKINQTIEMLNMIPIEVIKQNKNLRDFIAELIKLMDEQQYS